MFDHFPSNSEEFFAFEDAIWGISVDWSILYWVFTNVDSFAALSVATILIVSFDLSANFVVSISFVKYVVVNVVSSVFVPSETITFAELKLASVIFPEIVIVPFTVYVVSDGNSSVTAIGKTELIAISGFLVSILILWLAEPLSPVTSTPEIRISYLYIQPSTGKQVV